MLLTCFSALFPAHAKTIVLDAAGSGTFTVPSDWNNADNSIEVIGGGGGAAGGGKNANGYASPSGGGGGGAYAKVRNLILRPGDRAYYGVGAGGAAGPNTDFASAGGDTWFNGSANGLPTSTSLGALAPGGYGGNASYKNVGFNAGGVGGQASAAIGHVTYSGGDGGKGYYNGAKQSGGGGGGGGAAGPNGNGLNGQNGNGHVGGAGGAGDNGLGGAGGGEGQNGSAGVELSGIGSGGGGGGSNRWSPAVTGRPGNYGAGAGGPSYWAPGVAGVQGVIMITYTPLSSLPSYIAQGGAAALPASETIAATASTFGVSSSGAATHSTPIMVPVGSTGVQPKITLDYTSGGGKGPLGFGGSIGGLSAISRCGSDLFHDGIVKAIDYSAGDKFCLNGERLVPMSGDYGADGTVYRTALDGFSKVVSYGSAGTGPQYFKVWKKSGEILEYGNSADSFIGAIGRPEARAWAMNRLSDTAGNYIKYSYFQNAASGEYGIDRIDYTGNATQGLSPYNSVQFVYDDKPREEFYFAGAKYASSKRLTNVKVFADGALFRDYRLAYLSANQLGSITECTADACLKPTTFTWATTETLPQGTNPFIHQTGELPREEYFDGCGVSMSPASGDFNNDGRTDFLLIKATCEGQKLGLGTLDFWDDFIWFGRSDGGFDKVNVGKLIPATYQVVAQGNFGGKGSSDLYLAKTDKEGRKTEGGVDYVLVSKGDGTFNKIEVPTARAIPNGWMVALAGNFRGNGLTDLFLIQADDKGRKIGTSSDRVRLANGDGTFRDADLEATKSLPVPTVINSQPETCFKANIGGFTIGNENDLIRYKFIAAGDFNGNGLTDFLVSPVDKDLKIRSSSVCYGSQQLNDRLYLSRGDGTFDVVDNPRVVGADEGQSPTSARTGYKLATATDLNGDGLAEIYLKHGTAGGGKDRILVSKGDGSFQEIVRETGPQLGDSDGVPSSLAAFILFMNGKYTATDSVFMVRDFYGSGVTALHSLKTIDGKANEHFILSFTYDLSLATKEVSLGSLATDGQESQNVLAVGDFKGDGGVSEYIRSSAPWKEHYMATAGFLLTSPPRLNYLVKSIENGLGNRIDIEYKPLTDESVYTKYTDAAYPVQDVVNASYVVSRVTTDDGIGGRNGQRYHYAGLKEHVNGLGSLGFAKMTSTDEATGIVTESAYNQFWEQRTQGELGHSQTVAPDGTVLEEKFVYWASKCTGDSEDKRHCFRYSPQSVTTKKDLNGTDLGTVTENSTYDDYGFLTRQEVETRLGSQSFSKITANTYTHDSSRWVLGRLTSASVTHKAPGTPDQVRTSAFTYDPSTGLLSSETIEPGNALSTTKTYVRNGFGAVTEQTESWASDGSVTAANGSPVGSRTTRFVYDERVRYKVSETNPLGQTQTSAYDPLHGLATSSTGPNGLTTSWTYNSLGQLVEERRADGTRTRNYSYNCSTTMQCPVNGAYLLVTAADGGAISAVYKDKLHRVIRQSTQGFDGRFVHVDTVYDAQGRVLKRSEPYLDGDPSWWSAVQYDLIGRPVVTTKPDTKTETVSYNGLTVTSTNALGQTKTVTSDVLGRMTVATDTNGQSIAYSYDAIGQLVGMTDPNGNVTSIVYDVRGNKVVQSDPDKGSWTYAYNALGQLASQIDAKGQVTRVTYDVLGRMLSRTDDASGSPQASYWVYDTAAKGVGKLAAASGYGYSAAFTYDELGRPSAKTETMDDGSAYTVTTSYDALSRPASVSYPTGLTVGTAYTASGHLAQLSNASSGKSYWQARSVDARGNVTQSTLGNGVGELRAYDAATGYLTQITSSSASSGTIQNLSYQFDTLGNLLSRKDQIQAITETFQYDRLNRVVASTVLPTAQPSQGTTVAVSYDALGNIVSKSDVGAYAYGGGAECANPFAGPHAVTSVSGAKEASYCYDGNGNLTTGGGRVVTWTAFNMPSLIAKDLRRTEIVYGPDRARFKRVDENETGATTTFYVAGGAHEVVKRGSTVTHKTYIAGVAVEIEGTGATETLYLLKDHLGSTDVITDAMGAVQSRLSFDAWGKRRDVSWAAFINVPVALWQSGKITRGYTGHEQLDEVGLVHMNGRVYDPELGRFLSADPFIQDATNLQALNPYTYVQNNPLSFTDPSGYFLSGLFKAIGKVFSRVFKAIAHAIKTVLNSSIIRSLIQVAVCSWNPVACVAAAGALTAMAGGSLQDAFKAMAFSIMSIATWTGVGEFLKGTPLAGDIIGKGLVHGTVGGALSVAQGGDFLQGFAANAVGAATGLVSNSISGGDVFLDSAIVGASGGMVSVLTGGKFANGFITAAFANLYNKWAQRWKWQAAMAGARVGGAVGNTSAARGFIIGGALGYAAGYVYDWWYGEDPNGDVTGFVGAYGSVGSTANSYADAGVYDDTTAREVGLYGGGGGNYGGSSIAKMLSGELGYEIGMVEGGKTNFEGTAFNPSFSSGGWSYGTLINKDGQTVGYVMQKSVIGSGSSGMTYQSTGSYTSTGRLFGY
ncbi:RHS repeat-associated core domain-containing protein [Rhodomicrobium lacus]|uniref:RHS repeat-associated core domain-containing protein n=1 Tax=Rhodomicrobium lacus TaxID=2498452 RepID=UPI000F8DB00A|nr:RHS repeat-associated core domain-containing protein [Rhodomicrobium lacus]